MLRGKGVSKRNIEFPRFGNSYARKIHFTFLLGHPISSCRFSNGHIYVKIIYIPFSFMKKCTIFLVGPLFRLDKSSLVFL